MVERANQYLETSFLPGRTFTSPADFTTQLTHWLTKANRRTVRALRARPVDLLGADQAAMLALPPLPPRVGFRDTTRLGRDYSVDPSAIGQLVDVVADLDTVTITGTGTAAGLVLASHRRCWDNATTITDPDHVTTAARLRAAFLHPTTTGPGPGPADGDGDLVRDLGDYDRAFGLDPAALSPPPPRLHELDGKVA